MLLENQSREGLSGIVSIYAKTVLYSPDKVLDMNHALWMNSSVPTGSKIYLEPNIFLLNGMVCML